MIKEIKWCNGLAVCDSPVNNLNEVVLTSKPISWVSNGFMFVGYVIDGVMYDKPVLFGEKRESVYKRATHVKFIEV